MSSVVVLQSTAWKQITDALSALYQYVSQGSMEQSTVAQMVQQLESTAATSLAREHIAVVAAVDELWSTGQVEGQNTRVKLIKRQMDGRATFDRLRRRVLYRDDG